MPTDGVSGGFPTPNSQKKSGDPSFTSGPRKVGRCRRPGWLRFGEFEFDPDSRDLIGPRGAVRLQPQPAKLLKLLAENSGAVVSRETVRRHLWSDETYVEFDQSMNTCIKRIRAALDDSAETPRYIETLPRLGYRFLEPVTETGLGGSLLAVKGGTRWRPSRTTTLAFLLAIALTIALVIWRAIIAPPCPETESAGRPEASPGPLAASHLPAHRNGQRVVSEPPLRVDP